MPVQAHKTHALSTHTHTHTGSSCCHFETEPNLIPHQYFRLLCLRSTMQHLYRHPDPSYRMSCRAGSPAASDTAPRPNLTCRHRPAPQTWTPTNHNYVAATARFPQPYDQTQSTTFRFSHPTLEPRGVQGRDGIGQGPGARRREVCSVLPDPSIRA